MAITVKHSKVSTIPDDADTSLVRPSDWNADHTLVGTIDVANGGTGATTLTGYVKGNGTSAMTAVATVPSTDITGLGTMSTQNANAVAITGGTINGTTIGATAQADITGNTINAFTKFVSPDYYAQSILGGNLRTSGGTSLVNWDGGGSGNVTVNGGLLANPANKNVSIAPTGTGTATINPATAGTINNMSIGATTPSTVTATTITGQTARLNGTGTNLLLQSNTFNTSWTLTGSALTSGQSDPFGGSTAWLLAETAVTSAHSCQQTITYANNIFTISGYFKANQNTFVVLSMTDNSTGNAYAQLNLSNGVVNNIGTGISGISVGSWTNLSASATSVGNGWYRFSVTGTKNAGSNLAAQFFNAVGNSVNYAGTAGNGIFIYGLQVEIGSSTNSYVATTTTAVYGTPTLSFSGVSTIGLESNGALFVQPAGTGALQAQATTSSTVGGNARGSNAVDWQTARGGATQVASGAYSVIGGGQSNQANGFNATIVGGNGNQCGSSIGFVGGGASNNGNGSLYTAIVGGQSNTAAGYYNFIGAGFTNSGTSSSAVTTQSGTMNATTAVTLSGSNANIKVGQYISGTSIAGDTYVAAISGTSLTLSKNASGSSTSTLSFFTPHGVVVGGGNNQATGSYSFIGGGGDAGTAANRNVASGDWSTVGGGWANRATGTASTIAGGGTFGGAAAGNQSTGTSSFVSAGWSNIASGNASSVLSGASNQSQGTFSVVLSGTFGLGRLITGHTATAASDNPMGTATLGGSQTGLLVLARQTTDATPTALASTSSAAGSTNQVILPNNSAYFFRGEVVSGVTGGGDTKGWTIEGVIKRGANAGTTALVGIPTVTSTYADLGAATWDIAVTADTTNGGIRVTFTGQLATTIRTVCQIRTTEMTF